MPARRRGFKVPGLASQVGQREDTRQKWRPAEYVEYAGDKTARTCHKVSPGFLFTQSNYAQGAVERTHEHYDD